MVKFFCHLAPLAMKVTGAGGGGGTAHPPGMFPGRAICGYNFMLGLPFELPIIWLQGTNLLLVLLTFFFF